MVSSELASDKRARSDLIMRLSKALIDMDMADYSEALDPAYTTLEFENMQVLAMGNGESFTA